MSPAVIIARRTALLASIERWPAPLIKTVRGARVTPSGARRIVRRVLERHTGPLEGMTAVSLTAAVKDAGYSGRLLEPLALARRFLRWCKQQGLVPAYLFEAKHKTPLAASAVCATPAQEPTLLDALFKWPKAMPRARFGAHRKAMALTLWPLRRHELTGERLSAAVRKLGYGPRYGENVLVAIRAFLRDCMAQGLVPRSLLLTLEPRETLPMGGLPPPLTRQVDRILLQAIGLRTRRPWSPETERIVRREMECFYAFLSKQGRSIRKLDDLHCRDFNAYQASLQKLPSRVTGRILSQGRVRAKMMSLLMLWNQAAYQEEEGVLRDALIKFRLVSKPINREAKSRPPLPLSIMERLTRFDEQKFERMSAFSKFHYLRNKAMLLFQRNLAARAEDVVRMTDEAIAWHAALRDGRVPFKIKNGKSRPLGTEEVRRIHPPAMRMIKRWVEYRDRFFKEREIQRMPTIDPKDRSGRTVLGLPLFPSRMGTPLQPAAFCRAFKLELYRIIPEAFYKYCAHSMRHGVAVDMLHRLKLSADVVAYLLRDNVRTVHEYYARPQAEQEYDDMLFEVSTSGRAPESALVEPQEAFTGSLADAFSHEGEWITVREAVERHASAGLTDDAVYRAAKEARIESKRVPRGGTKVIVVSARDVERLVNEVSPAELSELIYNERRPSQIYKDIRRQRVPVRRRGPSGKAAIDPLDALRIAIGVRRSRRQGIPPSLSGRAARKEGT